MYHGWRLCARFVHMPRPALTDTPGTAREGRAQPQSCRIRDRPWPHTPDRARSEDQTEDSRSEERGWS